MLLSWRGDWRDAGIYQRFWWHVVAFVLLLGFALITHNCDRPGPVAEQFPVPSGQRFIVAIYACTFTCGRSFTVCIGWGLFSFWSFLTSVFSHPPLPLLPLPCFLLMFQYLLCYLLSLLFIKCYIIVYYNIVSYYFHWTLGSVWRVLWLGLGLASRAHGRVVGRAGFWDVLAIWVKGRQFQPLGSLAPNLYVKLRR